MTKNKFNDEKHGLLLGAVYKLCNAMGRGGGAQWSVLFKIEQFQKWSYQNLATSSLMSKQTCLKH